VYHGDILRARHTVGRSCKGSHCVHTDLFSLLGFSKVPLSLTLGGYDSSRFIPNDVIFPLGADNERDILVNINSITTNASSDPLLASPIYSFIDSTVAEIWLPISACQRFEKAFNLTFDTQTQLYLVSDSQHAALTALNPNITFTLSVAAATNPTVQITLPYAAFDLIAKSPYRELASDTKFFPLRRADNDTQYTLGRTFLQEAYLTVDWERQNFTVSQCSWVANAPRQIVPIVSQGTLNGTSGSSEQRLVALGAGALAGIVIGVAAVVAAFAALVFLLLRRRKNKKRQQKEDEMIIAKKIDDNETKEDTPPLTNVIPKVELDAEEAMVKHSEMSSYYKPGKSCFPYSCPVFVMLADCLPSSTRRGPNKQHL
jgi:hypothetical protein